jgi:hypothetical protein
MGENGNPDWPSRGMRKRGSVWAYYTVSYGTENYSNTSDGNNLLMMVALFPARKEICKDEMISQPYRVGVKSRESPVRLQIIKSSKNRVPMTARNHRRTRLGNITVLYDLGPTAQHLETNPNVTHTDTVYTYTVKGTTSFIAKTEFQILSNHVLPVLLFSSSAAELPISAKTLDFRPPHPCIPYRPLGSRN